MPYRYAHVYLLLLFPLTGLPLPGFKKVTGAERKCFDGGYSAMLLYVSAALPARIG